MSPWTGRKRIPSVTIEEFVTVDEEPKKELKYLQFNYHSHSSKKQIEVINLA
jgi:hypothetical protein